MQIMRFNSKNNLNNRNECINKKDEKKNDTIAKLPKRNNKHSAKTSTVNNSSSLSIAVPAQKILGGQ